MRKIIEKIIYSFGINISGYDVLRELRILDKNLPENYKKRDIIDLGCGDGKISIKLMEIFNPKFFLGVDSSRQLIKKAKKRGINSEVRDIELAGISGDIGILWGVLHHFNNPAGILKKLSGNFKSLVIRESIDDKRIFEIGNKFNKNTLFKILAEAEIDISEIIEIKENKSLILFSKVK